MSLKDTIRSWLNIQEAPPLSVNIVETFGYELNVIKNQLWYRGDGSELHQFWGSIDDNIGNTNFWAARATTGINFRKVHSGLPALIVDTMADIVVSDLIGIELEKTENAETSVEQERWDAIAHDNNFKELLKQAVVNVLVDGDGAFKISYDKDISEHPLIEFFSGNKVEYTYKRGRLQEIIFKTTYKSGYNTYILHEVYSQGGIQYRLYDKSGKEVEFNKVKELDGLEELINPHKYIMAEQMMYGPSPKWEGRGKSLLDGKSDVFDSLDEIVSQWVETTRDSRTNKYIPQNLIPQDAQTGKVLKPNSFDNRYIATPADRREEGKTQIEVVHGDIPHDGLLAGYMTMLDLCLQGLISPSTLGIDMKKLDNAEAQREKEKATLYTRNKIVNMLENTIPRLVDLVLKVDDTIHNKLPRDYVASVQFGEYANPSFEAQIETISKAYISQIMSIEKVVEELYGDSMTDEEKATEVARLKSAQGIVDFELGGAEGDIEREQQQLSGKQQDSGQLYQAGQEAVKA